MAGRDATKDTAAQAKARQHLQSAYRIDPESSSLVGTSKPVFLMQGEIVVSAMNKFKDSVQISENSADRSNEVSKSAGIEGNFFAFSGAAEASLEKQNSSTAKTIRADHDLAFIKYVCTSDDYDYSKVLTEQVVVFLKESPVEQIEKTLGHFYCTEVTLGGNMQLTRIIKAYSEDTASSMRASIEASYNVALVGGVKANASAGSKQQKTLDGREETISMTVEGGDVTAWLAFTGTPESKEACQTAWAKGITDQSLYPMGYRLSPIWEALERRAGLEAKAAELKKHLLSKWKADFDRVSRLSKRSLLYAFKPGDIVYKQSKYSDQYGTVPAGGRGKVLGNATDGDTKCVCVQWEGYGRKMDAYLTQISRTPVKMPDGYKIGDKVYSLRKQGPTKNGTVPVGGRGEVVGADDKGRSDRVGVQWEGLHGAEMNVLLTNISKSKC